MDVVWNRSDLKISFSVPYKSWDELMKHLRIDKNDLSFLCICIDLILPETNDSTVYCEASILSDLKVEVPESAD